ncbi:conserved hypothetical protein [uncultured Eubacteriales bacterium]|uniref:Uncharacterized protein n=1 Tax=uncultured Eubacteriales bacterium TaxID=172733 RepID=A0A212JSX4_9FIRM|nr:conserved hypothetical protein [uncultured Eubacteriales bacterium]
MSTELTLYDAAPLPTVREVRGNYIMNICGQEQALKRDVHFGVIPGTKKPSLYKAGAEKIVWMYGVTTSYILETATEDVEKGYFFYRFRCDLIKNGLLITSGYGSANSREKGCGTASGFDVANSVLKKAKKRAMVDGALLVGQLSDLFSQDMENEDFMKTSNELTQKHGPDDPITTQQARRIFAVGRTAGLSSDEVRDVITASGYDSTKKIPQKDYDAVCSAIESAGKKE